MAAGFREYECSSQPNGILPRVVRPDLLWTGGCLELTFRGEDVHGPFFMYCVKGSEKTIIVDTGHPAFWDQVSAHVETFLQGRSLDYVFSTHAEFPHDGLLPNWLNKYPNAVALGDLRDYGLYYPNLATRMKVVQAGDFVDLGDRKFIFVPAVWRDLNNSLWGFETAGNTLFVADAFSYTHYHDPGQCDYLSSELPAPDVNLMSLLNELALDWTKFSDARETFADFDALYAMLRPKMIASAHGGIVDNVTEMLPLVKQSMLIYDHAHGAA